MARKPFGYCLNTSTIRCGDIRLEDAIAVTAKAGYDGIEPWVREVDAYTAAGGSLDELRRRFEDAGLKPVNLIGFFDWAVTDEEKRRKGFEEARRCFDMAAAIGCTYVAAPPMGITDIVGIDYAAVTGHYARLIELGRGTGVTPLLEFWGFSKALGRLGEALRVAAECGCREARILADVFHMYKGSGRFDGLSLLGPDTLGLFHVNDYPAVPLCADAKDKDRVYPGDGVAPLASIFRDLHRAGYRGMLSVELFNPSYWAQPPLVVARTGLRKLKTAVKAALA